MFEPIARLLAKLLWFASRGLCAIGVFLLIVASSDPNPYLGWIGGGMIVAGIILVVVQGLVEETVSPDE